MSQEKVENHNQALGVLVQAAHVAQKRGAFDLEEATLVAQAIKIFSPPDEDPTPPGDDEKE